MAWSALDAEPIPVVEEFFDAYEVIRRGDTFYTMPRKRLDDYFLNSYLKLGGQIKDRATVRKINLETNLAECVELRTKKFFRVQFGNLIGADGATSTVRKLTTGKKNANQFCFGVDDSFGRQKCYFRLSAGRKCISWRHFL